MDSKVKDAMAKVLEDPVDGVNVKLDKVLELLKENFLAVEMQLRPAELLVTLETGEEAWSVPTMSTGRGKML